MELSRRGLLGLLGGAILGAKVIGPKLIAEPTPAVWEAAKALPRTPLINTYVPLETVCAETLRILDQELKWLHLRQQCVDMNTRVKQGDTFHVRDPPVFVPWRMYPLHPKDANDMIQPMCTDRLRHITIDLASHVRLLLDEDPDCEFGQISKRYIEPAAHSLAEEVIQGIRRQGGGEVLVTAALNIPSQIGRGVIARSEETGLVLRGVEYFDIVRGRPEVRIDMLYGVG